MLKLMNKESDKIKNRGPDNSNVIMVDGNTIFAFHRLSIMGTTASGNQPLVHPEDSALTLICNGEIYNYVELKKQFNIETQSTSDTEVLLKLYNKSKKSFQKINQTKKYLCRNFKLTSSRCNEKIKQ